MDPGDSLVRVGRIAGAYGIRGWVKVRSFTDPAENLFGYAPWRLLLESGREAQTATVLEYRRHGKGWVACLDGVADRDAAEALRGLGIGVPRASLPALEAGRYYWTDLEGLRVERCDGLPLGRIDHMLETGAADVMVIVDDASGARHLVPFVTGDVVTNVDLGAGLVRVDWDDEDG